MLQTFFSQDIGLSQAQIAAIQNGQPVTKALPSRMPSEVFLFAHSFAMGGEVAKEVRPADLTVGGVEVVVGAPEVRAADPVVAFAEHALRLGCVPAGRDPEDRRSTSERAPQHPAIAARLPPGLVDVDDRGLSDLLLKASVGGGERFTGALHDRVHGPG